ncbi:MAG TPA: signal peptidase II [Deltaproteobacteria bacterium]|nr:signal peptidase II [Deltaproteobacteria bacterium]HPR55603.1 signal peptidase II [Deltaproteobacteria bacterium]HXK48294.1 signal peptidase II [Deltaproteobacteria bacterium]
MARVKRILPALSLLSACAGCDQATKAIARTHLQESGAVEFLHGLFRLQYAENQGAFLGLGTNVPEELRYGIFILLVGMILAGMLLYLLFSKRLAAGQAAALSLVLGGGLGNLIDRMLHDGRVIDFMNLGIGSVRTGIFNVADVAILAGILLLLALSAGKRHEHT